MLPGTGPGACMYPATFSPIIGAYLCFGIVGRSPGLCHSFRQYRVGRLLFPASLCRFFARVLPPAPNPMPSRFFLSSPPAFIVIFVFAKMLCHPCHSSLSLSSCLINRRRHHWSLLPLVLINSISSLHLLRVLCCGLGAPLKSPVTPLIALLFRVAGVTFAARRFLFFGRAGIPCVSSAFCAASATRALMLLRAGLPGFAAESRCRELGWSPTSAQVCGAYSVFLSPGWILGFVKLAPRLLFL